MKNNILPKIFIVILIYICCACYNTQTFHAQRMLHAYDTPDFIHATPSQILEDSLSLSSTTTWREFAVQQHHTLSPEEKWVWVSSITIKSKLARRETDVHVRWHGKKGEKLDTLSASLFSKRRTDECITPIEENLVCDGTWDKNKQEIIFHIDEKIVASNDYHMMLSFPKNAEKLLKRGKFVVIKNKAHKHTH